MGDLKKIVTDKIGNVRKVASYKGGQKTEKALSDVIDKVVDIILKK